MAGRKKIIVQTLNSSTRKQVHFCYVDGDLKVAYKRATGRTSSTIMDKIAMWASVDFGLLYPKLTPKGISAFKKKLRHCIFHKYTEDNVPLEIIGKNPINGWMTTKMKEEIEYGRTSDKKLHV